MKTYLCGGINGLSDAECKDWRAKATELLNGHVIDPMVRDYRGSEAENADEIVVADLIDIAKSAFVLVNATRPSWGTAMEVVYAYQMPRVKVVAFVEGRVSPWLQYHCNYIVPTLEEACSIILRLRDL